jgi:hypothetical protein
MATSKSHSAGLAGVLRWNRIMTDTLRHLLFAAAMLAVLAAVTVIAAS